MRHLFFALMIRASVLIPAVSIVATAGDNVWTTSGPFGGFVDKFSFHPHADNIVFVSTNMGVFRSMNMGVSWKRVLDVGGMYGYGATIRIDPRNNSRVIAGAGGIYESMDGGVTWTVLAAAPFPSSLQDMEFDPSNPSVIYGLTDANGVYKSTDGGVTWTAANNGLHYPAGGCCQKRQLEVDPSNGRTIYVLLGDQNGATAYKSTNGGGSWKAINKGLEMNWGPTGLVIDPKTPSTLYACGNAVFKSVDAGASWTRILDRGTWGMTMDATSTSTLYLLGDQSIVRSTDGGAHWSEIPAELSDIFACVAVHPRRAKTLFVGGWSRGVFRSTNTGKNWQLSVTGLDSSPVGELATTGKPSSRVFAITGGAVYDSVNAGKTWKLSSLIRVATDWFVALDVEVHRGDPKTVAALAQAPDGNLTAMSRDGGGKWTLGSIVSSGVGSFPSRLALDAVDPQVLYTNPWPRKSGEPQSGDGLGVAKSTDGGKTWRSVNTGLSDRDVWSICTDPSQSGLVYVGTMNGKFFVSNNGGGTWKNWSWGLGPARILRITIDPADSRKIYLATMQGVYKHAAGVRNWRHTTQDLPVQFVAVDPSNPKIIYAGTFGSLAISTDEGETWSRFDSNGLGPFMMFDMVFDPTVPNQYYIGTERGVFSYTLRGQPTGPLITQIAPADGKPGDEITINGERFGSAQGSSRVQFTGADAGTATSWTDTSVKVRVPPGAASGPVTVTVSGLTSNPQEFVVLPASGNVTPDHGPAAGGTRVTILALSDLTSQQFNVIFGNALATNVGFQAPNIVTCDSPAGAGTVDVSITTGTTMSNVGTFRYE